MIFFLNENENENRKLTLANTLQTYWT